MPAIEIDGTTIAIPAPREAQPAAIWCSACGPSMCALNVSSALRGEVFGVGIHGHHADRHGHDGPWHGEGAAAVGDSAVPGEQIGLTMRSDKLSLFEAASGRAIRTALHDPCRTRRRPLMAEVRAGRVSKRFGQTSAVQDLSLTIDDGEFVVLLGPTGAGKTTTLRLVAGLEQPDVGRIWIGGRDMTRAPSARARRGVRVPTVFALSAPVGVRQPCVPAPLAGACRAAARIDAKVQRGGAAAADRRQAVPRASPPCPAARCSASRSDARSCGRRRST